MADTQTKHINFVMADTQTKHINFVMADTQTKHTNFVMADTQTEHINRALSLEWQAMQFCRAYLLAILPNQPVWREQFANTVDQTENHRSKKCMWGSKFVIFAGLRIYYEEQITEVHTST